MKRAYLYLIAFISVVMLVAAPVLYAAGVSEGYTAQGIVKINAGQYSEALELLEKALELSPDNSEAKFYAAVAYARLGKLSKAEGLFKEIMKEDKFSSNVYLELGSIYYAWGECRSAEDYLTNFKDLSDDTGAKGYADSMIEGCNKMGTDEKPYKLELSVGGMYDNNVILEQSNPPVNVGDKHDSRIVALITAGARVFENKSVRAQVDYNFYQSFHASLDQYNVHYHALSPSLELTVSDIIKPTLGYKFEYINFGSDEYGLIHTSFAEINFRESKSCSLDLIYKYKDNDYKDTGEFTDNSDRKGNQNIYGIKQNFAADKIKGDIHYFYDENDANLDHWSYEGQRVGGLLSYRFNEPLVVKATVDVIKRDYDKDFPGLSELKTRQDDIQKYGLTIQYVINEKMAVSLIESFTNNDSNLVEYDYDRNVIGLLFTYGVI
jgi:tetratricopeptide (TPR) repeat protein